MKFMSWNIDGLKQITRKGKLTYWLLYTHADIYAIQETQVQEIDPTLSLPGYTTYWSFCKSKPRYSGTAVLTKIKPLTVREDLGDPNFDTEGRILTLEFDFFYFVNVYVPNSQVDVVDRQTFHEIERKAYRRGFDERLRNYLTYLNERKPVIVCGDFNAASADIDMAPGSNWRDGDGFSKTLGANFRKLLQNGFIDTFRVLHPKEKDAYTCWNVRDVGHHQNKGRRIDYFLVSDDFQDSIEAAQIHPATEGSDHCPISLYIQMPDRSRIFSDASITYDDLLRLEKSKVYFKSLQNVILSQAWDTVDWKRAEAHLADLQRRLAKVAYGRDPDHIRALQWKIVTSIDAKLLAVRAVASGKGQAGVDGIKWSTPHEKAHAAISLTSKNYQAKPARMEIQISKHGQERPIHIDTYYDRAMQTLYGYSLAPVAESWSDRQSYACRRGRSPLDVNYQVCKIYSGPNAPQWAFKADVRKYYETISHDWIRKNIPMASTVLEQFLSAGYIFSDHYYETEEGIGIGSRLSHLIANMALDGLQDYIYDHLNANSEIIEDPDNGNVVRFADDILVSARDEETADYIGYLISNFIEARGLQLNEEKSGIVNVSNDFDFLKRHYHKGDVELHAAPSHIAVSSFKASIEKFIMSSKWNQEDLIEELNKKIIGFASFHRVSEAEKAFRDLDAHIQACLLTYCMKRYPSYNVKRIIKEFWFHDEKGRDTFAVKGNEKKRVLFFADTICIPYHPLRRGLNPYIDIEELEEAKHLREIEHVTGVYRKIWSRQAGCCYFCREPILRDEERELVEINPGERNIVNRMAYIHKRCHDIVLDYVYEEEDPLAEDDTKELLIDLMDVNCSENLEETPLYHFFAEQEKPTVTVSFKKLGEMLSKPLFELAQNKEFWFQTAPDRFCACWLENGYHVKKVSLEGRKYVTFHKVTFTGDTVHVDLPDIVLYGKLPINQAMAIKNYVNATLAEIGLSVK